MMTKQVPQGKESERLGPLTGKDRDQGAQAHHKRWSASKVADLLANFALGKGPCLRR